MSNALTIKTLDGAHVGFALTHFDTDATQPGTHAGECLFVTVPADRGVVEHPLVDLLYAHKFAGPHRCVLTIAGERQKYNIEHERIGPLQVLLTDGAGDLIDLDSSAVVGKVNIATSEPEPFGN